MGLLLRDFVADGETGIALPPHEVPPAGYLDGAERYLFERLPGVADRSVGSEELQALVHDWPTLYHLTPYRATIFDCLGLTAAGDARVLKLGAGCGAITRWLGEHCGDVHAIEGDRARAGVARARCQDQANVHLYAANYSGLDEREAFELVTLIGVLEYGHLYHPGPPRRPVQRRAREPAHRPRGAARRRRARARDREQARPEVLQRRARGPLEAGCSTRSRATPTRRVPATFSARELERLLLAAGFASSRFSGSPHPDYKLATTIVDARAGEGDDEHIHNWLDAPAPDRGAERGPLLFDEQLAQREAVRAGLLRDLANSFLVLAYPASEDASAARLGLDTGWTARHYSLGRRPAFQKRATLTRAEASNTSRRPPPATTRRTRRRSAPASGSPSSCAPSPMRAASCS